MTSFQLGVKELLRVRQRTSTAVAKRKARLGRPPPENPFDLLPDEVVEQIVWPCFPYVYSISGTCRRFFNMFNLGHASVRKRPAAQRWLDEWWWSRGLGVEQVKLELAPFFYADLVRYFRVDRSSFMSAEFRDAVEKKNTFLIEGYLQIFKARRAQGMAITDIPYMEPLLDRAPELFERVVRATYRNLSPALYKMLEASALRKGRLAHRDILYKMRIAATQKK